MTKEEEIEITLICCDLTADKVSIGWRPLFSASAIGTASNASANALTAYCHKKQADIIDYSLKQYLTIIHIYILQKKNYTYI